jgi:hypothetical protein
MRNFVPFSLVAMGVVILFSQVKAEVKGAEKTQPVASAAAAPSQEEMMKKMEEMGRVTDQHKSLDYLVGDWKVTAKMWPAPGAKPEESTGKAHFEPMFEGRFIRETFEGQMMGKAFQGVGYLGYDNMKKKYTTTWMDSMSTGVFEFEGDSSDKGKTITSTSEEFTCPMTGAPKKIRAVMKKVSKNEVRYEHYDKDVSGKEFKMMELVYKK